MAATHMTVEITSASVPGDVIAAIEVPDGHNGALTGAADLPAGIHEIYLRLSITAFGGVGQFTGAAMQVITGQVVDEPGCTPYSPSGGET